MVELSNTQSFLKQTDLFKILLVFNWIYHFSGYDQASLDTKTELIEKMKIL
jgi:hypothetical protein